MKSRFITRMSLQSTLLLGLVGCSDATQFTETTTPAALDAIRPTDETIPEEITVDETTTDSSTSPMGEVLPEVDPVPEVEAAPPASEPVAVVVPSPVPTPPAPTPAPVPPPVASNPPASAPIFSECSAHPDLAIVSQLYQLPANTTKLPDFSTMVPTGDVCLGQLNIADRDFTQGFPGVSDIFEWFALDLRFKLNIATAGNYQFSINSDDGSILYIDDAKVIDNDGNHAQLEKSGTKFLSAGVHDIRVKYYQGPRTRIALELFWKVPGSNQKVYIPKNVMMRP